MANLIISEPLAARLQREARRQNKPIEAILDEALSLVESKADNILTPEQQLRRKVYILAREYWKEHNDTIRLALTDAELDELFWLIDSDGIPRLRSEQGTVTLPPDPLEALIGLVEKGPADLSESVRETMDAHYHESHGNPL